MNRRLAAIAFTLSLLTRSLFAADFDSRLKLKVFLRGAGDVPDRVLGFTPAHKGRPIRIPEGKLWYIRPIGPLSGIQLDELAREMKKAAVPGLDLSDHWELSNASLRHLTALSKLRMLDLSRTRISDQGMSDLKSFPRLSILILPAGITDQGADALQHMSRLQELGLDETRLTDRGLAKIASLPALEILDLSSTPITDKGMVELQKCPRLRRLVLGGLITDEGAAPLGKLKTLQEIDISQTQLGEEGLAALSRLPHLRSVSLGRGVTDRGLSRLSNSPSLKALDLSRTPVTDDGVKFVSRMKTLEELALSQTAIGDQSLVALSELSELRILDLSDTHVTPSGLAPLGRLKKLEVLSLSWQTLTRDDLRGMSRLKQVRTIVLNGVPVPEATMAKLRRLSPWDTVAGLGTGPVRESSRADPLAVRVSLTIPTSNVKTGALPEVPKTTAISLAPAPSAKTPSVESKQVSSRGAFQSSERAARPLGGSAVQHKGEEIAMVPSQPERISALKNTRTAISPDTATLKEAGPRPGLSASGGIHSSRGPQENEPPTRAAPAEVASKGDVDSLLQVIRLQSNPAKGGAFSGLSGMRQLQRSETIASLNTVATGSQPSVPVEEDKPENSLGEISVGVVGPRHR